MTAGYMSILRKQNTERSFAQFYGIYFLRHLIKNHIFGLIVWFLDIKLAKQTMPYHLFAFCRELNINILFVGLQSAFLNWLGRISLDNIAKLVTVNFVSPVLPC